MIALTTPAPASRRVNRLLVSLLVVLATGQLLLWAARATVGAGLRFQVYGSGTVQILVEASTLLLAVLAAKVASTRPQNPVGWLLLASCLISLLSGVMEMYAAFDIQRWHRSAPLGDLAAGLQAYMWIPALTCTSIIPTMLFPDGRMVSPRWRPLLNVTVASTLAGYVGRTFGPGKSSYLVPGAIAPKVYRGAGADALNIVSGGLLLLLVCFLLAVATLVLRYRRAGNEVRHQVRWLLVAVVAYLVPWAGHGLLLDTGQDVQWLADASLVGQFAIPIALTIAMLKYRLYDIDVVINRALVYGALAIFITAVYVAIVVGVGSLVGAGARPNLVLSILATAIVAGAFQPVRERVQRVANRMVYGKRATPYEVLSDFSGRVAESYASNEVLARMAQVLAAGTGSSGAEVWLRAGNALRRAASWPGDLPSAAPTVPVSGQIMHAIPGADRAVPVRHQGELLGALTIRKRPGEILTPIEEKLLDDLGHQAGLVLKNVGLTADLQARLEDLRSSRQRLVSAQEEERRRLERNLHDGAQQHLVAIKVKLGLVAMLVNKDVTRASQTLATLKSDTDEALQTLRDLARGIYPPLLADKGLVAALDAQARKATLPVEVVADRVERYPRDVEAAIYFCCLEALQNVQKYAGASHAGIVLSTDHEGQLSFEVHDDGRGFDDANAARGSGLQNIEDRLQALGGELRIKSAEGKGTTLRGTVPVPVAVGAES